MSMETLINPAILPSPSRGFFIPRTAPNAKFFNPPSLRCVRNNCGNGINGFPSTPSPMENEGPDAEESSSEELSDYELDMDTIHGSSDEQRAKAVEGWEKTYRENKLLSDKINQLERESRGKAVFGICQNDNAVASISYILVGLLPYISYPSEGAAEERLREAIEELHRRQRTVASGDNPPCDHADNSCVANAIGNLCQTFLLSYGVRVGIGILLRAFKHARRQSYSSLLDLKQLVSEKDLIVREEACRIGLLFGGFTGSYHLLRCLLRKLRKKDTPVNALCWNRLLAGSIAGLSILALDDSSRRRTLALYLLARLAQARCSKEMMSFLQNSATSLEEGKGRTGL
ncbi:60S ribosomal protein L13-1-like [Hibiscus syriacus]|uniref:60S ribosomal protein L13-1-like n=1 Tax=Hibiscus syriacus TaxID=106335 RepID=A0A6A2ZPP3_HIBSY|nr:60S ribosomal protein L13-1-like [Hibiscus syriacus]